MAKARITTPEGYEVDIEGTPKEITALMEELKKKATAQVGARLATKGKATRLLLVDLIASLIDGGFFKTPRDLAAIKAALAQMGYHYPVTTLSPTMLRQVRKRQLRRIRDDKRWVYTQ